ncbi:MAG: iron-containing alcohol dehydrogenase [Caldilinea sp. CFX5]|nr:iron-containing alcohol dehydrogenase [Caldilinea sp. CFX5]
MFKQIQNLPVVHLAAFAEIEEKRPVLLVTSLPAWRAVQAQLHLPIAAQCIVHEATTSHWDDLLQPIRSAAQPLCEVVYAVGGGLVADAAKYAAAQLGLPLVCLPTALSVDAFITSASGIRRDGCVVYIPSKVPETLILDLAVIAAAPASIRAAGICDLLSIATGCWDWHFAHERGKNPPGMAYVPWVAANAQSILQGAYDCAEAAGRGDPDGLKTLYDCLALEVQLCNQIGHSRPEEGSEHFFAYAVENVLGHGLPHGDLVGPGILIAAQRQGQETTALEQALNACHIPLNNIPPSIIEQTLHGLPAYCVKHKLWYSRAHEP